MVKNPPANAEGTGSTPGQGTKIPHALRCGRINTFSKKRKGRVTGTWGQTSRWDTVGDRGRQARTDMHTHKRGKLGSGTTRHEEKTSSPDEEAERHYHAKRERGASLVGQRLRICLPTQRALVRSQLRERRSHISQNN